MIKRLIFDVDNTLIDWRNEYWDITLDNVFRDLQIEDNEEIRKIIKKSVDNDYEKVNQYYNKQKMLDCINNKLENKLPMQFMELCLKHLENCVPKQIDEELVKTLEYLNKKYEMVILTNWFCKQQEKRLENIGILKYFKKVYAPENFKMKPYSESYIVAMENYKPEECIMIGDDIERDVKGALKVGMNAIYYDKKTKKSNNENEYIIINNLKKLMDIL